MQGIVITPQTDHISYLCSTRFFFKIIYYIFSYFLKTVMDSNIIHKCKQFHPFLGLTQPSISRLLIQCLPKMFIFRIMLVRDTIRYATKTRNKNKDRVQNPNCSFVLSFIIFIFNVYSYFDLLIFLQNCHMNTVFWRNEIIATFK